MNASASDRHRLHVHLEQRLGPEGASTRMAHLPPSEWDHRATTVGLSARRREARLTSP